MFETQGGTRNRARDLTKKVSAFITSPDHWTKCNHHEHAPVTTVKCPVTPHAHASFDSF